MHRPALTTAWIGLFCGLATAIVARSAASETYSLSRDFAYRDNDESNTWSFRLDDAARRPETYPRLTTSQRDANALWGSDFPAPPRMWSDESGYWGIGKNLSGGEQVSTRNGTHWAPGEVLLHPKAGDSPAHLVVCWTAPRRMVIDVDYSFAPAAVHGNGIGYEIILHSNKVIHSLVALDNIGSGVANQLQRIAMAAGDRLLFRFHTCGDPTGDISRAEIIVNGTEVGEDAAAGIQPQRGTITAGSDVTFHAPMGTGPRQWCKNGQPIASATDVLLRIPRASLADSGVYSVTYGSTSCSEATLQITPPAPRPETYASPVPRQQFSSNLADQERELASNALQQRFAVSRLRLATDPYRPIYHFTSPESQMNDPNGLCFWQGRWHLFYQAYPPDEFPAATDVARRRQHWGHAVSDDLVHWRDLPYAIYPGLERMCFSGGTVVEDQQVVAFYPGIAAGQMVALASDPLLLNWTKLRSCPVQSPTGDACIWKEGSVYYGLVGADHLVSSTDLTTWSDQGEFLEANPFPLGDAGACPNFVPIGNKHLLLSFSHSTGGQYLLGDYDSPRHKFKPYAKGRFNHGTVSPGGVHAPSAAADGNGGVINILNINDAISNPEWDQIMSLPQHLTLGPDTQLRIEPVAAVASLRGDHVQVDETILPANREVLLDTVRGNTIELDVEIEPRTARWVQLNVLRSPNGEEHTSITFFNFDRKLSIWYDTQAVVCLDASQSSVRPDVWLRPPERCSIASEPLAASALADASSATAPGKPVHLRVFVDRSVVEVFVNARHYLALRVYPGRTDSLGVSLRAQGQDAVLKRLDAWTMGSCMPPARDEKPGRSQH